MKILLYNRKLENENEKHKIGSHRKSVINAKIKLIALLFVHILFHSSSFSTSIFEAEKAKIKFLKIKV